MLFNISFLLYALAFLFYISYFFSKKEKAGHSGIITLFLGTLTHLLHTILRFEYSGFLPVSNIHESITFFVLCIIVIFLVIELRYHLHVVGAFILPVPLILSIVAISISGEIKPLSAVLKSIWFEIHIPSALLSYAVFTVSLGIGIAYLIQEKQLKSHNIGRTYYKLPSLEILDSIGYKTMSIGVIFLTVAIFTGAIWEKQAFGYYWRWDPKEVWSLIVWLVYILALHIRLFIGWRGRKTAYLSIIGFCMILFTFFAVNFLSKFHGF